MSLPTHAVPLLAALLAAACASAPADDPGRTPSPAGEDPAVAAARAADDAALGAAAADPGNLEGRFLAVAGGRVIGGTPVREEMAMLLRAIAGAAPDHAYFFAAGSEGGRREPVPAIYRDRLAGAGLLDALHPSWREAAHTGPADGPVRVVLEPASGLGTGGVLLLWWDPAWKGTALLSAGDAATLGLHLSEIPGEVEVVELLSGRLIPCRRALVRVSWPGGDGDPVPSPAALVEVLFPK